MITALPTPIEMETPLGSGHAMFIWEWPSDMWWGVAQADTGEIWWWRNHHVRVSEHISEGRLAISPIMISDGLEKVLKPHRKRYPERKKAPPE